MNRHLFSAVLVFLIVLFFRPVHPQAQQETYPIPVSESVEKTGPGTMVFLSYPKYYRNAEEKLAPVETNLVDSSDPEWDYEVNKGIWQLKVKTDGTFQVQHEGDIFTYRFQSLGIGQGGAFRSVDLGEPDFSNYQVMGDTIRWTNVLPDVDLTVRYLNHILKVDVIVKKAFMNDLRTEVNAGILNSEEYLTARFDVPSVFVNSQAKQGEQTRDLYAEALKFSNAPLAFERDGKVLHKIRPVETYVLDQEGNPIYSETAQIHCSQRWQLQRGGGGFAEMSANLGDLAEAPEGDVVIDPSTTFNASNTYFKDNVLKYSTPSSNYGSSSTLNLSVGSSESTSDRLLIGVSTSNLNDKVITSAKLRLYLASRGSYSKRVVPFLVTEIWNETSSNWTYKSSGSPWQMPGGSYDTEIYMGGSKLITESSGQYVEFDVTNPLKRFMTTTYTDIYSKGFLLKFIEGGYASYTFNSYDHSSNQPELVVEYATYTPGSQEIIYTGLEDFIPQGRPDGPLQSAYFNNRWHYYFTGQYDGQKSLILAPSNTDGKQNGLSALKSNIDDYLLRDNGSGGVTYDSAVGVPHIAYEPFWTQFIKLPNTDLHKDWFSRMAAFFANWIEDNGSSMEIHAFFHAEDNHIGYGMGWGVPKVDETRSWGRLYSGTPPSHVYGQHVHYGRIGYAKSTDGYEFVHVDGNANVSSNPGPLIECWMSEADWRDAAIAAEPSWSPPTDWDQDDWQTKINPNHLGHGNGCKHPNLIEYDGYLYLFYERTISKAYWAQNIAIVNPNIDEKKSTTLPDGSQTRVSSICVARANVIDFKDYNGTSSESSPWYKFFDGQWSTTSSRKGVGGYSSPVVFSPYPYEKYLEFPNVSFNKEINQHIMLVGGKWDENDNGQNRERRVYLFADRSIAMSKPTFSDWGTGMRLDDLYTDSGGPATPDKVFYPQLVSNDSLWNTKGDTKISAKQNYLYYGDNDYEVVNKHKWLNRFTFEISE